MKAHRLIALFSLLFVAGLLDACSVFNPGPPSALYTLSPRLPAAEGGPVLPFQLMVSLENPNPAIATRRIAVRPENNEIRYFSGVAWVESAPDLIRRYQIESLEATKRLEAVSDDTAGFLPNYRLSLEVRDFSVHYTPDPVVELNMTARLVNLKNGKSMGFLRVEKKLPTSDSNFDDVVSTFNTVLGNALAEVSLWTVQRFSQISDS